MKKSTITLLNKKLQHRLNTIDIYCNFAGFSMILFLALSIFTHGLSLLLCLICAIIYHSLMNKRQTIADYMQNTYGKKILAVKLEH
jgi:predicted membrane channel-forming protein YqfA (hemolysin III family)